MQRHQPPHLQQPCQVAHPNSATDKLDHIPTLTIDMLFRKDSFSGQIQGARHCSITTGNIYGTRSVQLKPAGEVEVFSCTKKFLPIFLSCFRSISQMEKYLICPCYFFALFQICCKELTPR